ncbi:DNA processing protein [Azospirillaceae bacterium]
MSYMPRSLSDSERLDWLRLIRTENVGPITFFRLLEKYGTASIALQELPGLSQRGGRAKPLRPAAKADAERELAACARLGVRLIAACEPNYPPLLAMIDDPPPLIAVRGHAHLLLRPAVAMVGARNASLNGKRFATRLAQDLGAAGYVVISGMARGIDAAVHEGALAVGTAAVLGCGVDVVYPEENQPLYQRLVEQGVVVSETPLGAQPHARNFPRRNRLISGLSLGVVVVEAAPRSGSLITARVALEQGREVFAVPGSPMDPRSQGCNNLIREGAALVESAQDVIREFSSRHQRPLGESPSLARGTAPREGPSEQELVQARALIAENLSPAPVPIDELVRECQLSAPVVLTVVLELELAGRVQRHPGNQISLL